MDKVSNFGCVGNIWMQSEMSPLGVAASASKSQNITHLTWRSQGWYSNNSRLFGLQWTINSLFLLCMT